MLAPSRPPAEDMRVHGVGSFLEVLAPGVGLGLACLGKEGPVAVTDARDAAANCLPNERETVVQSGQEALAFAVSRLGLMSQLCPFLAV